MIVLLLVLFLAIMLIGTPVGFAMGALTNISFGILGGDQSMIAQKLFSGIDTYTYVCILLFILATDLMSVGGITSAIVNFCEKLVGHVKGGLAHVNVLASMLFAGLSGSAVLRGINGYLDNMSYATGVAAGTAGYTFTTQIMNAKAGIIQLSISKTSAFENATNNTPIVINGAGNESLVLTFV